MASLFDAPSCMVCFTATTEGALAGARAPANHPLDQACEPAQPKARLRGICRVLPSWTSRAACCLPHAPKGSYIGDLFTGTTRQWQPGWWWWWCWVLDNHHPVCLLQPGPFPLIQLCWLFCCIRVPAAERDNACAAAALSTPAPAQAFWVSSPS